MKIVFLSFYSGYVHRGMETVVHELAKRLAKNHQVTVFQTGPKLKFHKPYQVKTVKLSLKWPKVSSRSLARKLMIDYYYRQIFKFTKKTLPHLKQLNPDIIMPVNGGWQTLLIKRFTKKYPAKLILVGQAGIGWDDRWNLYQQPDIFIALNQRNLTWSKKQNPRLKFKLIPNGVDLNKFTPQGKKLNLKLPKPVILCVAGPQAYKRISLTIKAVSQLPHASLLLIGGNTHYQALAKKYLGKRFKRLSLPHHKMPQAYRSADIFTLVSESTEAFALVYLEALATGLPVVAPDDQLRREILGPHALYTKDPSNIKDYADKLNQALKSPKQRPDSWLKQYSWDTIASKYQKAFQHALKNK